MRQRVDPFIPITKRHTDLKGQYGTQYLKKPDVASPVATSKPIRDVNGSVLVNNIDNQHRKSIDGVARLPKLHKEEYSPRVTDDARVHIKSSHVEDKPKLESKLAKTHIRKFTHKLRFTLFIGLAICVGLSLQYLDVGEFVIAVYAVFAMIRHVSSRTTFILALVALICIVLLVVLRGDSTMSEDFAVYAFLLLVVGTISLGLETRRHPA